MTVQQLINVLTHFPPDIDVVIGQFYETQAGNGQFEYEYSKLEDDGIGAAFYIVDENGLNLVSADDAKEHDKPCIIFYP